MTAVPRKLRSSIEGALAAGGDPVSSPLYVFGPFLTLIVTAGVAGTTFGASVWLVVLTIALVSAMYRLVMSWISDGSGGSGLSEEEFGSPAVKLNASITFVEYTLTFAVSIAALVTFIADRIPGLDDRAFGLRWRVLVALAFSALTGWIVSRGPRVAARAFGPATAGVVVLLWVMVVATVLRLGLRFPSVDTEAFRPQNLGYTLGGYARILAVMTGIEVFANLVPAYEGTTQEKGKKAFRSLLIIMGTTTAAMLVIGPAILDVADATDPEVSVFTQTMDRLLPAPLALVGTLTGIAVLLSAAAASALGLQNLFAGLKLRRYLPDWLGRLNRSGVADRPVWLEVAVVSLCFLLLGTEEGTYLAMYAAGVFVLLSMTGWAAAKRLGRNARRARGWRAVGLLAATGLAALLTTVATVVIFVERFTSGVWVYVVVLPLLFLLLGYLRSRLGRPTAEEERIGSIVERGAILTTPEVIQRLEVDRPLSGILVPMDGSALARRAVPAAAVLARAFDEAVVLLTVTDGTQVSTAEGPAAELTSRGVPATEATASGPVADAICGYAEKEDLGLIVMSTHGRTGSRRLLGSVAERVVRLTDRPVLLVPSRAPVSSEPSFGTIVASLDGSIEAERVVPFASSFARRFGGSLLLLRALDEGSDRRTRERSERYLERTATRLREEEVGVETRMVVGDASGAILQMVDAEDVDLLMIATHGRGGLERLLLGSVALSVVRRATAPVLLVPILERRATSSSTSGHS